MNTTKNDSIKNIIKKCNLSIATIKAMEEGNKIYEKLLKRPSKVKTYTVTEAICKMKSW